MKVKSITDYLTENLPVLHLTSEHSKGAYLHTLQDSHSVVLSISEEKFKEDEIQFLMNTPIEIGAYEKNNNLLLLAKIGPNENPYIYTLPLDPVLDCNQGTIDMWVESRFIVVCFVEGTKELTFRGIRVLGITDEMMKHVALNWKKCIEQGYSYSLKYNNFLQSTLSVDTLELWNRSLHLGGLEE